ncbi:hypothetical protein OXX69_010038 [Metschnikowia pulcherrima]
MRIVQFPSLLTLTHREQSESHLAASYTQLDKRLAKRSSMPTLNTASSTSTSSRSHSASASHTSSISSSSHTSSRSTSSSSAMPSVTSSKSSSTGMPAISATSSSTSYTYKATVPTGNYVNPFISKETLPTNSVFIVVAGVLGILGFGVLLTWLIIWFKSRRRAQTEKEVQYYNSYQYEGANGSAQHLLGGSSQSSLFEKSNSSIHSKFSDPASLGMDTTTPGRSYREMSNAMGRHSSMTISPVLEMMRSASNLELPLFNPAQEFQNTVAQTPTETPPQTTKSRPPSQILDDMLAAIEFSSNYPDTAPGGAQ